MKIKKLYRKRIRISFSFRLFLRIIVKRPMIVVQSERWVQPMGRMVVIRTSWSHLSSSSTRLQYEVVITWLGWGKSHFNIAKSTYPDPKHGWLGYYCELELTMKWCTFRINYLISGQYIRCDYDRRPSASTICSRSGKCPLFIYWFWKIVFGPVVYSESMLAINVA